MKAINRQMLLMMSTSWKSRIRKFSKKSPDGQTAVFEQGLYWQNNSKAKEAQQKVFWSTSSQSSSDLWLFRWQKRLVIFQYLHLILVHLIVFFQIQNVPTCKSVRDFFVEESRQRRLQDWQQRAEFHFVQPQFRLPYEKDFKRLGKGSFERADWCRFGKSPFFKVGLNVTRRKSKMQAMKLSAVFSQWTLESWKRFLNLVLLGNKNFWNFGLVEIYGSATAKTLWQRRRPPNHRWLQRDEVHWRFSQTGQATLVFQKTGGQCSKKKSHTSFRH